ncbi:MAG: DOMON-like domain-containing protein [Nitrospirae bacterium]|nr:DOMON-like domain-containing protein [Nitrospirota bacterium]
MIAQSFSLKQFQSAEPRQYLKITGNISRSFNKLSISYLLKGRLSALIIPVQEDMPARRKNLWEETCFEFFVALNNSDKYWEFNLSPAGHWNVYSFNSYRKGMQEEPAFASLPFAVHKQSNVLELSVNLDLSKIITADQALKAAISAVIRSTNDHLSFWALNHPGSQPDFHSKSSFLIEL